MERALQRKEVHGVVRVQLAAVLHPEPHVAEVAAQRHPEVAPHRFDPRVVHGSAFDEDDAVLGQAAGAPVLSRPCGRA